MKRKTRGKKKFHKKSSLYHARPMGQLAPPKLFAKLRYVERLTGKAIAANGVSTVSYRGNGCFDPAVAVGGHQPMGFDQYMGLYLNFTVIASKITVSFISQTAATDGVMTLRPASVSTDNSDPQNTIEQVNTKWLPFSEKAQSTGVRTLSHYYTTKKQLGRFYNNENLRGTSSADPVTQWYWNASFYNNTSTLINYDAVISIDYFVIFDQRDETPTS